MARLASLAQTVTNTANNQSITFAYNPAGQIASVTRTNDLYAFTAIGSGSTASVANGLNQIASIGGAATAHDSKGNLTTDPTTGKSYTYSSENLLTASSGGTAATLAYDPAMRLSQLTAAATTRFAYDGVDLIAEYDAANAVTKRYVHGPGTDETLVEYDGATTTTKRWLHADERGSIIAQSDVGGNVTAINRYDEYGKPQSTNAGRFQYTGQTWLAELGLYYYKARMYAPHLGRFMQTDPIGYGGGVNLYAYVGNDPVNSVDPMGLQSCDDMLERTPECLAQDGSGASSGSGGSSGAGTVGGPGCPCIGLGNPGWARSIDYYEGFYLGNTWISTRFTGLNFGWSTGGATSNSASGGGGQQSVIFKLIDAARSVICEVLSSLPAGTGLSLSASGQAYGGIGGYLSVGVFVDASGNTGANFTRGWGAGFGAVAGVGVSLERPPAAGRTRVSHVQGGMGTGYWGASASYSKSEGWNSSGGISAGPRLGLVAGSVDGRSSTAAGGNICK